MSRLGSLLLASLFCAGLGLCAGLGQAQETVDLMGVTAATPSLSGTGCPGPAAMEQLDDTNFEFELDAFTVRGGEPPVRCDISQRLSVPPLVSVRLIGTDVAGIAMLADGAMGMLQRSFRFAGQPRGVFGFDLPIGFKGSFLFIDDTRDKLPGLMGGWTPCSMSPTTQNAMVSVTASVEGEGSVLMLNLARAFKIETQACTLP